MKKLLRLLLYFFLFLFIVLSALIFFNASRFSSVQVTYPPAERIAINDQVISRFSQAVQFPTISKENLIDTTAFINLLTFIDSQFVLVDSLLDQMTINQFSKVYHWPGKNRNLKPVLLIAHLDVVPVEKESQQSWTQPPYSGAINENFIWGRGTLDDKISVFGILEGVELLLQQNYFPERTIYFAFGHDEEIGGANGAKTIAQHFQKEGVEFEYILDEGGIILENALPGMTKPLALIGIAEKGYTTLRLTAQQNGGGHSSMPPKETAVGILSKAILTLQNNPFPATLDGPTLQMFMNAGPETGWPYKALFSNLWLFEGLLLKQLSNSPGTNASIRTTTAPTILNAGVKENVLPSTATALVNFRIAPGETPESVLNHVCQTINDERVTVSENTATASNDPTPISDTEGFGYNIIKRTTLEIFPETVVAPFLVVGATDARHYQSVSDNIFRMLPIRLNNDDLKRIHGIDERISVEGYKDVVRFYRQLILNSTK